MGIWTKFLGCVKCNTTMKNTNTATSMRTNMTMVENRPSGPSRHNNGSSGSESQVYTSNGANSLQQELLDLNTMQDPNKHFVEIKSNFNEYDIKVSDFKHPERRDLKYNCPICFKYLNRTFFSCLSWTINLFYQKGMLQSECCNNYICYFCCKDINQFIMQDKIKSARCSFCGCEDLKVIDVKPTDIIKIYTDSPYIESALSHKGDNSYKPSAFNTHAKNQIHDIIHFQTLSPTLLNLSLSNLEAKDPKQIQCSMKYYSVDANQSSIKNLGNYNNGHGDSNSSGSGGGDLIGLGHEGDNNKGYILGNSDNDGYKLISKQQKQEKDEENGINSLGVIEKNMIKNELTQKLDEKYVFKTLAKSKFAKKNIPNNNPYEVPYENSQEQEEENKGNYPTHPKGHDNKQARQYSRFQQTLDKIIEQDNELTTRQNPRIIDEAQPHPLGDEIDSTIVFSPSNPNSSKKNRKYDSIKSSLSSIAYRETPHNIPNNYNISLD